MFFRGRCGLDRGARVKDLIMVQSRGGWSWHAAAGCNQNNV